MINFGTYTYKGCGLPNVVRPGPAECCRARSEREIRVKVIKHGLCLSHVATKSFIFWRRFTFDKTPREPRYLRAAGLATSGKALLGLHVHNPVARAARALAGRCVSEATVPI